MAFTGTPTSGADIFTVTPTGNYSVDGLDGNDRLVINYATLTTDLTFGYVANGWYGYSDAYKSSINFLNVENFSVTAGSGDDVLVGWGGADSLTGNAGQDRIESGLGADTINGGTGFDHWSANYESLAANVTLTLVTTGWANISASGARLSGIEQIALTTGAGDDIVNTAAFTGNDSVTLSAGNDSANLGRGHDTVNGGDGSDLLIFDWSANIDPAAGITNYYTSNGWYRFHSAAGDSVDYYGMDRFNLTGGAGDDALNGAGLSDTLVGNGGNDWLNSGAGLDSVSGGAGVDGWQLDTSALTGTLSLNLASQTTSFGAALSGVERLHYTGGDAVDRITGQAGIYNDRFATGGGNDLVSTGRGRDVADGGAGTADRLVMDWSGITDAAQWHFHLLCGQWLVAV